MLSFGAALASISPKAPVGWEEFDVSDVIDFRRHISGLFPVHFNHVKPIVAVPFPGHKPIGASPEDIRPLSPVDRPESTGIRRMSQMRLYLDEYNLPF